MEEILSKFIENAHIRDVHEKENHLEEIPPTSEEYMEIYELSFAYFRRDLTPAETKKLKDYFKIN